jgi:hypothetical protein
MLLNTKKVPAVDCPSYVKDWINKWSGLEFEDVTLKQIAEIKPKTFLIDEDSILKNMDEVFHVMEKNCINEMVIHALHIYKFNHDTLDRLDRLAAGKKVHLISMSYLLRDFDNIISYSHDMIEHGISHDFNYILSERLQNRREPHLDFIFIVNVKNQFRTDISNALIQSGTLRNSFVRNGGQDRFAQVRGKQSQLLEYLGKEMPGNMCMDALRSWYALPDFQAYEQAFCDIVVESANGHLDTTQNSRFSDLSEKTYRPIALGVPFVFLGSKEMFYKLCNDGYHIIDDGNFYNKWHGSENLKTALPHLINFLEKIVVDKVLRNKLLSMARHNYKNFWTYRKLDHRKHNEKICRECFGETVFDNIYDLLKV